MFKRGGRVYLEDGYSAQPLGGSTYDYTAGSFFADKAYTSFADSYDAGGTLTQHVETNGDGSHYTEIEATKQVVKALGADTFVDDSDRTRFVFQAGDGAAAIYGFEAKGAAHDVVSLPNSDAGRLARILVHATDDGQGDATLHLGKGDTVTFAGMSAAQLQKHAGDFVFHA